MIEKKRHIDMNPAIYLELYFPRYIQCTADSSDFLCILNEYVTLQIYVK